MTISIQDDETDIKSSGPKARWSKKSGSSKTAKAPKVKAAKTKTLASKTKAPKTKTATTKTVKIKADKAKSSPVVGQKSIRNAFLARCYAVMKPLDTKEPLDDSLLDAARRYQQEGCPRAARGILEIFESRVMHLVQDHDMALTKEEALSMKADIQIGILEKSESCSLDSVDGMRTFLYCDMIGRQAGFLKKIERNREDSAYAKTSDWSKTKTRRRSTHARQTFVDCDDVDAQGCLPAYDMATTLCVQEMGKALSQSLRDMEQEFKQPWEKIALREMILTMSGQPNKWTREKIAKIYNLPLHTVEYAGRRFKNRMRQALASRGITSMSCLM